MGHFPFLVEERGGLLSQGCAEWDVLSLFKLPKQERCTPEVPLGSLCSLANEDPAPCAVARGVASVLIN